MSWLKRLSVVISVIFVGVIVSLIYHLLADNALEVNWLSVILAPVMIMYIIVTHIIESIHKGHKKFFSFHVSEAKIIFLIFCVPIFMNWISIVIDLAGFYQFANNVFAIRYLAIIPVILITIALYVNNKDEDDDIDTELLFLTSNFI